MDFWACLNVELTSASPLVSVDQGHVHLARLSSYSQSAHRRRPFSLTRRSARGSARQKEKNFEGNCQKVLRGFRLQEEEKLRNAAKWHHFNVPPIYYTCDITGGLSGVITEPKKNLKKRTKIP